MTLRPFALREMYSFLVEYVVSGLFRILVISDLEGILW